MTALYVPPTEESDYKKQNQSLQLIGGIVGANTSAWTAFTPTLTALAGTYTTATAAGRYKAMGKTVFCNVTITITTVGTGTLPIFTLPVSALDINHVVFYGSDRNTGKTISARPNVTDKCLVTFYDNTTPAASGSVLELTGVYEAA